MDITGSEGINVYADAKTEYTRQLTQFCLNAFMSYFLNLLDESKELDKDSKKLLLNFQNSLKSIPEWNYEKVQKETLRILKEINCDYFDDLLSAVFVAHTKVLSAIRLTTKQKKLQITVPKVEHFLHHTLIECARILWSNVYLYSPSGSSIERQKNLREIERLIQDGILQSIRSMLPVKNILKEYLKDDGDDEDEDEEKNEKPEKTEKAKVKEDEEEKEEEEKEEEKEDEVKEEEVKEETKEEVKEETKEEVKEEEEAKEEVKEEIKEQDVKEEVKEEVKEDVKEEVKTQEETKVLDTPVIKVDTEPSVKFSNLDAVFDSENPEKNTFVPTTDEDDDEGGFIQILDNQDNEVDDFEEILDEKDTIEFEALE